MTRSVSAMPTKNKRVRRFSCAPNLIPPRKAFGLRSAQPMKKPPSRATIPIFFPKWCSFTKPLEPILARSTKAQPCRLRGQARARPTRKPPLDSFSEISPRRISFLAEKGLAGGCAVALATWRLILHQLNDIMGTV